MQILSLIAIGLVIANSLEQSPPLWAARFSQSFIQGDSKTKIFTPGQIWYDIENNRQRCDVQSDYYDLLCSSVSQSANTTCSQIIANDKLYIRLPEENMCCMCCTAAEGCKVTPRDWLKDYTYVGRRSISWEVFDVWSYYDMPVNRTYLATIEENPKPRRMDYGSYGIDFIVGSYSEDEIPESVFSLPSSCEKECPKTSFCANFRSGKQSMSFTNMFMAPKNLEKGLRVSQQ